MCTEILFKGQKWLEKDLDDPLKQPVSNFSYRINFDYDKEKGGTLHNFMTNTVPEFFVEDVTDEQDFQ